MLSVTCNAHHSGAQLPVSQLVAALQFFEHLVVIGGGSLHDFDCFMHTRIEGLTSCRKLIQPELGQSILELLSDQFDSRAKVFQCLRWSLQCPVEAVQDG